MTNDYIRREDAVDVFNRAVQDVGILDADDIETVFGMLSSADVVPVVRCKNCKYREIRKWCNLHSGQFDDDDFCSYGERRGEQDGR